MQVRTYSTGLVLAVAFAIAATAFAPTVAAHMDRPVWRAGDFWVYSIDGPSFGFSGTGRMQMDVTGTDTVTVGGTDYSSYHVDLEINVSVGSLQFNMPGEMWFRTSDLALVKMAMSMTMEIPPVSFTSVTTITYDPPQEIRWPLTDGNTWSATSLVTTVTDVTGQPQVSETVSSTAQYTVGADQELTVPAGTFSTTPLRMVLSGEDNYTRSYWSAEVGHYVSQKTYDSSDVEQGTIELTSYRHQESATEDLFGVSAFVWIAIVAVLVAVIVAVALVLRRKKPPAPVPTPRVEPAPPPAPPTAPLPPEPPPPPPPGTP